MVSPLKLFRLHHCTSEDKRDVRSSSVDSDEVAAAAAASEHASLGFNAAALFKMFQSRRYFLLQRTEIYNKIQNPEFVLKSLHSGIQDKGFHTIQM